MGSRRPALVSEAHRETAPFLCTEAEEPRALSLEREERGKREESEKVKEKKLVFFISRARRRGGANEKHVETPRALSPILIFLSFSLTLSFFSLNGHNVRCDKKQNQKAKKETHNKQDTADPKKQTFSTPPLPPTFFLHSCSLAQGLTPKW